MKKPAVTAEEIFLTLQNFKIFDVDGQLLKEKDGIWDDACNALGNRIGKHNLFENVRQDRHDLLTNLRNFFNISVPEIPEFIIEESEDEESDREICDSADFNESDPDFDDELSTNSHGFQKIRFNLVLDEREWDSVRPDLKRYRDEREYYMMKPDWTDLIAKKIHQEHKLTCPYALNQKFYKSENYPFFRIFGKCSDPGCQNIIRGSCAREFDVNSRTVTISIETFDTRGVVGHTKRRKVAGSKRVELRKKLKYAPAACHRNEVGNEMLEYSDLEAGFMETSLKSRRIRQEAIDRALKLSGPTSVFESLLYLQNNGFPEIRFVSQKPFVAIYCTDEQLDFLIDLFIRKLLKVSIDASGGYARIIEIFGHNTGPLFLYVMVAGFAKKICPLWQMLSEAHDANTIKFALKLLTKIATARYREKVNDLPITTIVLVPEEVVCDGSLALQNGVSLAYNQCSITTHLNRCFRYLIGKSQTLDPCRIRGDKAHYVHTVTLWKAFKNRDPIVKDFYVRCVGYCIPQEYLDEIKDVFITVFVVSHSTVHRPGSIFDSRLKDMMEKLKTYDKKNAKKSSPGDDENGQHCTSFLDVGIDISEESLEYREVLSNDSIREFLEDVYNTAMTLCSHGEDLDLIPNEFYCPQIKRNMFYLGAQFLAWTNVMNLSYKSKEDAISARSEAMFKNYDIISYVRFPVSANRCVLSNIQTANGIVKLAKADMKNQELLSKNTRTDDISEISRPKSKHKQARNSQSGEPLPDKTQKPTECANTNAIARENQRQMVHDVANTIVFKNGLRQDAMLINGVSRIYINTCAFDAKTEVIVNGYNHHEGVRNFVESRRDSEYIKVVLRYINDENYTVDNLYYDRNRLLHPLAERERMTDREVDCRIAVVDLIVSLMRVDGAETLLLTSQTCGCGAFSTNSGELMTMTYNVASLIINEPRKGLEHLQACTDIYFNSKERNCSTCNETKWIKRHVNSSVLMIELQHIFMTIGLTRNIKSVPPNTLVVDETEYELFGLIECDLKYTLMHYVAYVKVDEKWQKRDDLMDGIEEIDALPNDIRVAVLYYVRK